MSHHIPSLQEFRDWSAIWTKMIYKTREINRPKKPGKFTCHFHKILAPIWFSNLLCTLIFPAAAALLPSRKSGRKKEKTILGVPNGNRVLGFFFFLVAFFFFFMVWLKYTFLYSGRWVLSPPHWTAKYRICRGRDSHSARQDTNAIGLKPLVATTAFRWN